MGEWESGRRTIKPPTRVKISSHPPGHGRLCSAAWDCGFLEVSGGGREKEKGDGRGDGRSYLVMMLFERSLCAKINAADWAGDMATGLQLVEMVGVPGEEAVLALVAGGLLIGVREWRSHGDGVDLARATMRIWG